MKEGLAPLRLKAKRTVPLPAPRVKVRLWNRLRIPMESAFHFWERRFHFKPISKVRLLAVTIC